MCGTKEVWWSDKPPWLSLRVWVVNKEALSPSMLRAEHSTQDFIAFTATPFRLGAASLSERGAPRYMLSSEE